MIKNTFDLFSIAVSALGGLVGGLAKLLFTLENTKFSFFRLVIDCSIGMIIGVTLWSILSNYDISPNWHLCASLLGGMLGKETVDILLTTFKKKLGSINNTPITPAP